MLSKFIEPVLTEPICNQKFSPEFVAVCELAGFHTLEELLCHHTCDLLRLPGFNYHLLAELVSFLETRHMGEYVDPA